VAFYDHFAKGKTTGLGALIEFKTKEKEFNYITRYLNKDSEILEIGAGQGILANIFTQNGFNNYDVVEPNDIMRNNFINAGGIRQAKNYFIPDLQEEDASYDCIVLTHVFEHLNGCNEAKKFMSEARRILKPKGLIFIVCPDYLDLGKDIFIMLTFLTII
jgi:2-polyprenyl-3-methyl-5-hydroxy-6-metoxy-1,4-benzoquinol methylase